MSSLQVKYAAILNIFLVTDIASRFLYGRQRYAHGVMHLQELNQVND
ncbi:hypothetical protein [Alteromonas macleodii]|nr:hypothetical protein [Alteromonas macleodii]